MSYQMRTGYANDAASVVVTDDVSTIDLGDVNTADTWKLQPTRVDTNTAGTKTAAVTWNATNATNASAMQTAIRDLGGIYADATVTAGAAETYVITVFGGYNVTWAVTDATTFTPGSTVEDTAGKVTYTFVIPTPQYSQVARLWVSPIADALVAIDISDTDGLDVFVDTTNDLTSGLDDFLIVDGVDDAAAAVEVGPGVFTGPLTAVVATSAPLDASRRLAVGVLCESEISGGARRVLKRSTGTVSAAGDSDINLGAPFGRIAKIKIESDGDASADYSLTDDLGKQVFAKTGLDADPAVTYHLATDGLLQDGSASATGALGHVVVKSPVTATFANLTSPAKITVWVQV